VFVDADPKTYTIDCNYLESYLTKDTKALIPVHLYGNPADMSKVMKFARLFDLKVIEDCAQAIGAEYNEQKVGTFGDAAAFSFYPTKNLGGLAQGGAVITGSKMVAEMVESLANVGRVKGSHYEYQYVGYNSRLDSMNALFLTKCLEEVSTWNILRGSIAALYRATIDGIDGLDRQHLSENTDGATNVYHLFEMKCRDKKIRDSLKAFLDKNEISTALHYPIPCHKQIVYKNYNHQSFPVAEDLSETLLSLPIHPWLSTEEATRVVEAIKEFFGVNRRRGWLCFKK
jgi:dTDP-4-amino-4,6-dideoxygalactose transaminase